MKFYPQQNFLCLGLALTSVLLIMFVVKGVQDPILVQIAGDPVVTGNPTGQRTEENQDQPHRQSSPHHEINPNQPGTL